MRVFSGGIAQGIQDMRGRLLREFWDVGPGRRHHKRDPAGPEGVADAGEDIGEGGMGLGVPGGPSWDRGASPVQEVCRQDQPAEGSPQGRGGAGDGPVRPLRGPLYDQRVAVATGRSGVSRDLPTTTIAGRDRPWGPVVRVGETDPERGRHALSLPGARTVAWTQESVSARQGQRRT